MYELIIIFVGIFIVIRFIANQKHNSRKKINHDSARYFIQKIKAHGDWVVIDTETTGLGRGAEIVEVGVVNSSGDVLFRSLVKPKGSIPLEASDLHGITKRQLRNSPTWPEVQPELMSVLEGKLVLAYNAEYDHRMLMQTAWKWNIDPIEIDVDCIMLAYAAHCKVPHPRRPGEYKWHKLTTACKNENIKIRDLHSAVGDAKLAQILVDKLIQIYCD